MKKVNLCEIEKIDENGVIYASTLINMEDLLFKLYVTYQNGKLIGMAYTNINAEQYYEIKDGETLNDLIEEVKNDYQNKLTHNKELHEKQMQKIIKIY